MRQLKIVKQITNRESISFEKYLNEIGTIPGITAEEEVELAKIIQAYNEDPHASQLAVNKMAKSNLRFVISVAKQYQNQGLSLPDLVSAGNEGLIKAAKRFDHSRGFKFISYAVWWIRQSIMQQINEHSKTIRLPLNKVADLNKIRNATSALEQELERPPSIEEIAFYLSEKFPAKNFLIEDVALLLTTSNKTQSLDTPFSDDNQTTLLDLIKMDPSLNVDAGLINEDLKFVIKQMLASRLTQKEQEVIVAFFGLEEGVPAQSLEEIGVKVDLTRERVRQIKEKSLRKLRHSTKFKIVKEYL